MTQETRLTRVYRAGSAIEATFLKGILEEEGIPVRFFGPTESNPFPAGSVEIEIHVPEPLADTARKVLEDYEARSAGDASQQDPWVCSRCGEEIEFSFDACWNCHADHRD
jgi:hypothetical protein